MKCKNCGYENKNNAKFCSKCGSSLINVIEEPVHQKSSNSKYIIIALIAVIIVLAVCVGYFALNGVSDADVQQDSDTSQLATSPQDQVSEDSQDDVHTPSLSSSQSSSASQEVDSKSWVSIGSYSGSGSGSETISVPDGKIMVKLSAYPIKNYATNHLYVSGSNGESGGVDWGSKSAVETRSDSFTYISSSYETFTIDYYETVSWEVEFFRYQ